MSAKVSVIIVNINTRDVLRLCLQNLRGSYENLEIIISDMSSTDGSVEMVKSEFPEADIKVEENNGLAYGLNKALQRVTGEYYLYLGSDGFPKPNTIKGLVDYFEQNPKVGAASVNLKLRSGKLDMDAHRGLSTPWSSFCHFTFLDKIFPKSKLFAQYFKTYEDFTREHEIDSCITHFFFVRASTQKQVGEWDEDFFLYGEDLDMCYRIKQAGWKIMFLPQFEAEHWKGVVVGRKDSLDVLKGEPIFIFRGKKITLTQMRRQLRKESPLAMEKFVNKHYKGKYPAPLMWLMFTTMRVFTYTRLVQQFFANLWKKLRFDRNKTK